MEKFSEGKWSNIQPDIHIFDHHFVNENVHSGNQVGLENRRNFYRIAVGEEGVKLSIKINELDQKISDKQSLIKQEERVIEQYVPKGMKLKLFIKQKIDIDVDVKLLQAQASLNIADNSSQIIQKQELQLVPIPALSENLFPMLRRELNDVSLEATMGASAN